MNLIDNNEKIDNNDNEEITIKIRTLDKEFEIQIQKKLTIRALKEKIEEVILFIFLFIIFLINIEL
jgi:hypothetical protein